MPTASKTNIDVVTKLATNNKKFKKSKDDDPSGVHNAQYALVTSGANANWTPRDFGAYGMVRGFNFYGTVGGADWMVYPSLGTNEAVSQVKDAVAVLRDDPVVVAKFTTYMNETVDGLDDTAFVKELVAKSIQETFDTSLVGVLLGIDGFDAKLDAVQTVYPNMDYAWSKLNTLQVNSNGEFRTPAVTSALSPFTRLRTGHDRSSTIHSEELLTWCAYSEVTTAYSHWITTHTILESESLNASATGATANMREYIAGVYESGIPGLAVQISNKSYLNDPSIGTMMLFGASLSSRDVTTAEIADDHSTSMYLTQIGRNGLVSSTVPSTPSRVCSPLVDYTGSMYPIHSGTTIPYDASLLGANMLYVSYNGMTPPTDNHRSSVSSSNHPFFDSVRVCSGTPDITFIPTDRTVEFLDTLWATTNGWTLPYGLQMDSAGVGEFHQFQLVPLLTNHGSTVIDSANPISITREELVRSTINTHSAGFHIDSHGDLLHKFTLALVGTAQIIDRTGVSEDAYDVVRMFVLDGQEVYKLLNNRKTAFRLKRFGPKAAYPPMTERYTDLNMMDWFSAMDCIATGKVVEGTIPNDVHVNEWRAALSNRLTTINDGLNSFNE